MKNIKNEIVNSQGDSKIISTFISNRAENGENSPVFKKLNQRYLIIKLNYNGVDIDNEEIKPIWQSLEEKFDTSLLTQPCNEERKGNNENAQLVAIVDRLNKDRHSNNNEVNMLIDGKWRNFKTCIYKTNTFEHIIED